MSFPEAIYYDLEDPLTQNLFKEDILYQLTKNNSQTLILDESQVVPELFSALRSVIDKKRKVKGQFIILGPHNLHLLDRFQNLLQVASGL